MITFTPGPSHLSNEMKWFLREAIELDIASVSHRSSYFSEFSKSARDGLRTFFQVPDEYKIFYTYSATESMEIIVRSTVLSRSHHFMNGAFSKRFYDTALDLWKKPTVEELEIGEWKYSDEVPEDAELICITCTETSTWVMVEDGYISHMRKKYSEKLIAVDITSSGWGIVHHIPDADMWFFSLQKCFGLPAGMAILIMNEKAIEKSQQVYAQTKDIGSVHSLHHLLLRRKDYQTSETPNVLDIYLLSKQMEVFNKIGMQWMYEQTLKKREFIDKSIRENSWLYEFVKDPSLRAKTVAVIGMNPAKIDKAMSTLKNEGIILGAGYGPLAFSTIRVANFPSHTDENLEALFYHLKKV